MSAVFLTTIASYIFALKGASISTLLQRQHHAYTLLERFTYTVVHTYRETLVGVNTGE